MFLLFPRNYFPVGVRVDLQLAATHSCDHPVCELGIRCAAEALLLLLQHGSPCCCPLRFETDSLDLPVAGLLLSLSKVILKYFGSLDKGLTSVISTPGAC